MELEIIMLNKMNQTERDKYHMSSLIHGIQSLKMDSRECKTDPVLGWVSVGGVRWKGDEWDEYG
jgi:hypothetical protein